MSDGNPFDYLKSIQKTKVDMIRDADDPVLAAKAYNPFIVNKGLSFFVDSILYANEMNTRHSADNDQQYAYLINSVRSMNRKHTWFKKTKDEDVAVVAEYYKCNRQRAEEVLEVLSGVDLKAIKKALTGGGAVKK